jgi:hypothetical protein
VWHDGERWRAAIDSSDLYAPGDGRGLLADFVPMTDFDVERQYATLRWVPSDVAVLHPSRALAPTICVSSRAHCSASCAGNMQSAIRAAWFRAAWCRGY